MKKLLFCLLALLSVAFAQAQGGEVKINLVNASFEDVPKCCDAPEGWFNCGTNGETPPDVQPGLFEVNKAPFHGETYVGMVVRDNETYEAIGQRLSIPIEKDACYEISIVLARAELYLSQSRTTGEQVNYATPAKLRIYGGNGFCDKRELLAESAVIKHPRWLVYTFPLRPKKGNYSYITFEAYYNTPILFPYNGNVLMDNASPIVKVDCDPKKQDEPEVLAVADEPKATPVKTAVKTTRRTSAADAPEPVTYGPAASKSGSAFDRRKLKENSTIRLEKIYFDADKHAVKSEVEPALQEIYDFLRDNSDISIEIGGHTNSTPPPAYCDELSKNRAKAVADWLVQRGIDSTRVQYKGYGKRNPIYSNKTVSGRRQNQRVEVKILSIQG